MRIKPTLFLLCLLFSLFATSAVNSATTPTTSSPPPTANAFYLDSFLWPSPNIPVCWENYSKVVRGIKIQGNSVYEARMKNTLVYANNAWGAGNRAIIDTNSVSLLKFVDKGQCPAFGFFDGVRIVVDPNFSVNIALPYPPFFTIAHSPLVKGLGSQLRFLNEGVVFDFNDSKFYPSCQKKNPLVSKEECFKGIVVHEFGHIIGVSHEHNRNGIVKLI